MTTRCADSFRLFERVELAQREAQTAGCRDEEYGPYRLAFAKYQEHLRACPECRAWVREIMDMVREEGR